MTRRRADSFIQVHCPDGRKLLLESPGQPMLDAVLAAIGILPKPRRYSREALEADVKTFRAASRGQEPVQ